ncbi:hypothetical protein AC578_1570 [Pseudocercospora eumusae]|uniref:Uncharacterized protein n=1 Tax=Pseudocercospora eumusae TaxID=321146 RepID=A0A139HM16_9PEZI|nr:hypothetical protein AC578_1570 [Pseudocercospora eumusae]
MPAARPSWTVKALPPTPQDPFLQAPPLLEKEVLDSYEPQPWRPITFRRRFLLVMLCLTAILILIIVILAVVSSRNGGLLFDDNINNLPLRRSFWYLYLPTLISVLYSFLWTWVDLDIKRLEPFFQLSRPQGARADDSILLSYPLEFLVTVPVSAFKRKHWTVLTGSVIIIMIFWGLTPMQAGIFAVQRVTITKETFGLRSTSYIPLSRQGNLSSEYSQSVYNIAWMNETLPPFMTKEYVLSAFGPQRNTGQFPTGSNFTGKTTMYSVDVSCEPARLYNSSGFGSCSTDGRCEVYGNGRGCEIRAPGYRPFGGKDTSKPFDSFYSGYQSDMNYYWGSQDWGEPNYFPHCDSRFSHLFFVRWSKSTLATILYKKLDTPFLYNRQQALNDTSLFCNATYYQQLVKATIDLASQAVVETHPLAEKEALPADLFNVSSFELGMARSVVPTEIRGQYPTTDFPSSKQLLIDMPLNLYYLPTPAQFAIAAFNRPAEEYLAPEILQHSYQSAYRLFFSRQLVEVLNPRLDEATTAPASFSYATEAVVVVPEFAYVALAILCIIFISTIWLLTRICARPNRLQNDPATLQSLMCLLAGDEKTASTFSSLDNAGSKSLNRNLKDVNFALQKTETPAGNSCRLRISAPEHETLQDRLDVSTGNDTSQRDASSDRGVRPFEMKLVIGAIFIFLQLAALIIFFVLFIKAKKNRGRQLVENYLPIAFATLVEPFWLVLNRLLGLLQPFEELRKGRVHAKKAVNLDYSSLPPQLLVIRALRAKHFVLVLVCAMVLLANILAVALSGLMYEGTEVLDKRTILPALRRPSLLQLNGTGPPFNINLDFNWDGQTTGEPFYRLMSNLTAGTPFPPWADVEAAYLPLDLGGMNASARAHFDATGFGASLSCRQLEPSGKERYDLGVHNGAASLNITVTLTNQTGNSVKCTNFDNWAHLAQNLGDDDFNVIYGAQPGRQALEFNAQLSSFPTNKQTDLFCRQHILAGWMRADLRAKPGNASQLEVVDKNETIILCKPSIKQYSRALTVDSTGRVQSSIPLDRDGPLILNDTSLEVQSLISQANTFLTNSNSTWHNDSFPSDYNNYFIKQALGQTTFLNPEESVPLASHAASEWTKIYRILFALLIATNFDFLFENSNTTDPLHEVLVSIPETRILFSTPAFLVTQLILILYVITTIFFYGRRPWRVLPRLPSTVASNIAFFAASRALRDMSEMEGSGQDVKIATSSWLWSYGTFYGSDGQRHIGVEREVFVQVPKRNALPEK